MQSLCADVKPILFTVHGKRLTTYVMYMG